MSKSILAALISTLVCGCGQDARPKTLLVSAASDLQDAFAELGGKFKAEAGVTVEFNFAASGMLAQQIKSGAKVDVFASANVEFIDELDRAGLVVSETKRVYARGRLAAWSRKDAKKIHSLTDLLDPAVKRVAIANPVTAPYGMAASQALQNAGVWDAVKDKLVNGENIRQTMEFARSGNADVAIVSLSLTQGAEGNSFPVPTDLHKPIDQSAAVVKGTKNEADARRFLELLSGPEGRKTLVKFGFEIEN
jgi:molybdate transport system substrate-binding protein